MSGRLCFLVFAFLPFGIAQLETAGREARWAPYGEPYQERVVSMLPGTDFPPSFPPWSPLNPFEYPPPAPPSIPFPYGPLAQYYPPPPPPQPPVVIPVVANQEKQEQNSKDLDVGVYTGMDIPWTHIPPFSTTYKAGLGAQTPPPLMGNYYPAPTYPQPPAPPAYYPPPAYPSYYPPPPPPPSQPFAWPYGYGGLGHWHPRSAQYPNNLMRQQGGFGIRRDDDDVKLTVNPSF
ncbi:uncharacterized protein LOC132205132 isoform X2 [Neocloeon triangulifer]|uniref:uncharacterized protein LOC132205132 isoform X2 n=1 Tax=Neocloeon triangulifer TaxID=2078957 RepID=UPI00286EF9D0|nr:uncharacterized protein LOC132205132 isoform X2 [Neocloeon triangulifer]